MAAAGANAWSRSSSAGVGEAVANELSVAALLRKVMGCEGADVVGDERDVEAEHLGGVADAEFTCLA